MQLSNKTTALTKFDQPNYALKSCNFNNKMANYMNIKSCAVLVQLIDVIIKPCAVLVQLIDVIIKSCAVLVQLIDVIIKSCAVLVQLIDVIMKHVHYSK